MKGDFASVCVRLCVVLSFRTRHHLGDPCTGFDAGTIVDMFGLVCTAVSQLIRGTRHCRNCHLHSLERSVAVEI